MEVIPKDCKDTILIVTEKGYGKRTAVEEYRAQSRGGVGIITQKVSDKVGKVVTAKRVAETDQIMITTNQGQNIRMKTTDVSCLGRNTQGVRLINLNKDEYVTGVAVIGVDDEDEE